MGDYHTFYTDDGEPKPGLSVTCRSYPISGGAPVDHTVNPVEITGVVNSSVQIDVDAGARTFTRASGSFLTDGFEVGMGVEPSGFTNGGNNGNFIIEAVTATVITVTDKATGLVTETGSGDELMQATIPGHYQITATFTEEVRLVWDAGTDLIADTRWRSFPVGPVVDERDEGSGADAIWGALEADHTTANTFGAALQTPNESSLALETAFQVWASTNPQTTGSALQAGGYLRVIMNALVDAEETNEAWHSCTTTDSAGKFYASTSIPATARSATYVNRIAVHIRTDAPQERSILRITGIANDGGGDHFTLLNLDGTTPDTFTSGQSKLIVLQRFSTAHEVWGAARADHAAGSSFGENLQNAADAYVWNALRSTHTGLGSFGEGVALTQAASDQTRDSVWDSTGYFGAPAGGQNTAGTALFAALMTRVEGDGNFFAYYTTTEAASGKFYPQDASLDLTRSAELVDRLAYYLDTASSPTYQRIPCRITGVANDVTGDHFTLEKLDGTALTTSNGGFIFVTLQKAPEFEIWRASAATHAPQAGSMARAMLVSGAKLNVVMENVATTVVDGNELVQSADLVFYTDNTKTTEIARIGVTGTYNAGGTLTGFESLE